MNYIIKSTSLLLFSFLHFNSGGIKTTATSLHTKPTIHAKPTIQVAILLDVSNSMDGLIEQAKAQLWNMVSIMGKAQCNGISPDIEIALYEYGRPGNGVNNGYIKEVSGFTTDLDQLSKLLFNLNTDGGDEYCGKVIFTSLNQLAWDSISTNYKVIFIAGNEDFLQGDITYTKACNLAKQKGVIVNTIYCGNRQQGINEHWNLNSECGKGSFSNIDQHAKIEEIATPYDSTILTLNDQLNTTYLAYGYGGTASFRDQAKADELSFATNKSVAVKRAEVKGKKGLYKNERWDMVDASSNDEKFLEKLDIKTLPDSLKNKNLQQLKELVALKKNQRADIQNEIGKLSVKRADFISAQKAMATGTSAATLQSEIEKIIKKQAKQFNMLIP